MIDSSYIEMLILVAKPLTEEFDPPWSYVRLLIWGILPITILSLVCGLIVEPTPEYIDIRAFFFNLSLTTGILTSALYGTCAWHARQLHLQRQAEIMTRHRKFHD